MVTTKKTVTRYARRRYARGYRRYRSLSNVYFPCRVEGVYTISFPDTSGQPRFYDASQNWSFIVPFAALFKSSQYYGSFVNMFGFYKVTGVKLEVQTHIDNLANVRQLAPVILGFRTGSVAQMTYNELVADNNSLFLGTSPNKRYVSTMNSQGWGPTNTEQVVGAFSVATSITSTVSTMPTWSCELCVYIRFSKI